jgi:hypothetical protein
MAGVDSLGILPGDWSRNYGGDFDDEDADELLVPPPDLPPLTLRSPQLKAEVIRHTPVHDYSCNHVMGT